MKKLLLLIYFISNQIILPQWIDLNCPIRDPNAIFFKDSLSGIIIGWDYTHKTTDGGNTWYIPNSQFFLDAGLYFINNEVGFAYGYHLEKTTDLGDSWIEVGPEGHRAISDIEFVNDSTGYLIGDEGEIYITRDQGETWDDISYANNDSISLGSLHFINEEYGWITGFQSFVGDFRLLTTNGGLSWNRTTYEHAYFRKQFLTPDIGYAIDYQKRGIVYKTINGGMDWTLITSPFNNSGDRTSSIYFLNENIGFICGAIWSNNHLYGRIYKTIDAGETWISIYADYRPNSYIHHIFFLNENLGWALTAYGVYYTKSGGITSIEDSVENYSKDIFILFDNYPNPFNPNTKIGWQAPVSCWQTLKVYDVLGNEVATLVNEYRPAGSYEVEFKSTSVSRQLANGVYFYRFQTGDYVETKKMILLK